MPQNVAQEFARVSDAEAVTEFKEQEQGAAFLGSQDRTNVGPTDVALPSQIGLLLAS
jgi:hypothetical protein